MIIHFDCIFIHFAANIIPSNEIQIIKKPVGKKQKYEILKISSCTIFINQSMWDTITASDLSIVGHSYLGQTVCRILELPILGVLEIIDESVHANR